jgi:NADH:ubiquinone reductase (H+-translocating)
VPPPHPRIVVLGAGFAGLRAVRILARAGMEVLWLDGRNYHTFLPLLYQVATAGLEPQAIVYPTRSFLRHFPNVEFRLACIESGDAAARVLVTDDGQRIAYDHLIVATGGAAADFGVAGVREHAFHLYDVEDARDLRNHVLEQLERAAVLLDGPERRARLTIAIVGGGPTGVETAGALAEFRRHVLPSDYRTIPPDALRIVLIEARDAVLGTFDAPLRDRARRDLEAFGVEVRLDTAVAAISPDGVQLAGSDDLAAATVIWAAGIRAAPVAAHLGLPTGRAGRIRVEPTLQVVGHPDVFAAGDVAVVDGAESLPQVAQVAMQQGAHAAQNLLRRQRGEPLAPFAYRDKGAMATIGRSRAIAQIGRVHLTGALAWWAWLLLHVVMLIGFRNRLVVLVNWAWNYLTYDRGLRAIIGVRDDRRGPPSIA